MGVPLRAGGDYLQLLFLHIAIDETALWISEPQGPHSQILMTGRGSDRGSYFIQKKSQLQNLSTQKITFFLAYPQNPLVLFFATPPPPKSIDLKNHFWPKFQTEEYHSDPTPPPSLKYVSGAPGPWAQNSRSLNIT